ncbi:2,3-diaminopropionate biosynthesis protein SbnA [Chamaesiphon polymorphus]|uniref:N-(2-amino-2-carboxyethyl)-L-glutamate synthase n=1 Tax=Chamaesiphon polymorphus CCALA 037 TaxID=2107692 RepID=A0A2T1FP02_9CYAN|nr:2,3-diaminopropionate biosynthesis protein SbnA [Chamaesiphon polymorphus]PSB46720.1 2,3-diaminopropionate biosynthesis protein SbnA [Chamaesiphon polymorphus CCALA 037]
MSPSNLETKSSSATYSHTATRPTKAKISIESLTQLASVAPQEDLSALNAGILTTIGNTPLIKLDRVFKDSSFNLFAKLEMFNPGGSVKDRPAFNMLKNALKNGHIKPGYTIVESSSGNLGIGLAQACTVLGLHLICVVDPKTTSQNIKILNAYGAQVDIVTEPDPATGDFLPARIARVKHLLDTIPQSFWCQQYANMNNSRAHHQTMHEIATALDGKLDYLFLSTGTCGTLRGCSEYIKSHNLNTKIIAVDAKGSVIFGDKRGKRLIPGHGAARVPELFQPGLEDMCVHVSDSECIIACHHLLRSEAILAGGSSGAVIAAIHKQRLAIASGANCAAILCDRGERYLDTIYTDSWVKEHFGDLKLQPLN